MIAETKNEGLANAAGAMLYFNEDFWARKEAEDRAYFQFNERYKNKLIDDLSEENKSIKAENADLAASIADKDTEIADKDAEIARLKALIEESKKSSL